jgi:hypothetical protein
MPSIAMALMISFVPTAALNHKHTGSWSGDPTNQGKMNLSNPCAGFAGNSLIFAYSAVQPPVLPASSRVNDFVIHLLPSQFKVWLVDRFPRFELKMGEIPMEETAGLGLGFIGCFVLWIFKGRRSPVPLTILQGQPWFSLGIAGLISLLFFMAKMGSESTARLLLPYYPFLLLLPLGFWSLASGTLRKLAPLFTLLCSTALVGLFLCPARPLFPIQKFLTSIGDNPRFARVSSVYQTYIQRGTCWDPILNILPPDIKTLGFFSHGDDLEAPLWRPFGLRKIVSRGEKNITSSGLPHADAWLARRPIAEFLKANPEWQIHWKQIGAQSIAQKASVGVEEWAVFLPR